MLSQIGVQYMFASFHIVLKKNIKGKTEKKTSNKSNCLKFDYLSMRHWGKEKICESMQMID